MIWTLLIIPFIAIVILIFTCKHLIEWWEYFFLFIIPSIAIAIAKFISVDNQVRDIEFWNSYFVRAEYIEPYSTWDDETCSRSVPCGVDSDGDPKTCTEYYDCSSCEYHGPNWTVYDNIGKSFNIDQSMFEKLCKEWNNRTFVELNRIIYKRWNCGVDGDKYVTNFNGQLDKIHYVVTSHNYTNKVQTARSIYKFSKVDSVDKKTYKLFDYPIVKRYEFYYDPILGWNDVIAENKLQSYNAILGSSKKIHMLICVFENQPMKAGLLQEQYWKGGNKNEVILCLGISRGTSEGDATKELTVQWARTISWTEVNNFKTNLNNKIQGKKFEINSITDTLISDVQKYYKKKSFKDFNYINVEPTTNTIITTFFIVCFLTIGLSIFSIKNSDTL